MNSTTRPTPDDRDRALRRNRRITAAAGMLGVTSVGAVILANVTSGAAAVATKNATTTTTTTSSSTSTSSDMAPWTSPTPEALSTPSSSISLPESSGAQAVSGGSR